MMKLLLALTFGLLTVSSFGQYRDNYGFPLFEEVLSYLDKNIDRPCSNCYFGIAKKIDGYYLVLKEIDQGDISNRNFVKVWDQKQNKFIKPQIDQYLEVENDSGESRMSDLISEAVRFDLFRIYGYPEWIDDLTALFADQKDLSSKELEMLARANSEKASDFIHPNQYGNNFSFSKDFNDPMYEKIDASRIDSFVEYAEKSISCYEQILDRDPNYKPIIIDDLQLKINHDLMHYFEYLMSVKEPEKARSFLDRVNYSDGLLTYARHILNTCSTNAILITYGDSDSYPLWYLQETAGIRKDVTVLNNSLMQTAWYMAMAKERFNLTTSFSSDQYQQFHREYFLLDESADPVPFDEWIKLIQPALDKAIQNRDGGPAYDEKTVANIPKSVKIRYLDNEMTITSKNYYMLMLDLAMLDVIGSNPSRPVFSTSPSGFYDLGMYRNFASRCSNFEMLATEAENFTDENTLYSLEHKIEQYSPALLDQIKSIGNRELEMLYDNVVRLEYDLQKQKSLFKKLRSIYTQDYLFNKNDIELIQSIEESYRYFDPELADQLKDNYESRAINKIASCDLTGADPSAQVTELEYLFRLYGGTTYRSMTNLEGQSLSDCDKRVLKALKKKLEGIKRTGTIANLKWTTLRLEAMERDLVSLKL